MTIIYSTDAHGNGFRREPDGTTRAQVVEAGRRPFVIDNEGEGVA